MLAFKRMWNDVTKILGKDNSFNFVVRTYKDGVIVREEEDTTFITKEDFVDFWSRMLYFSEVSEQEIMKNDKSSLKYVYQIIKNLPYVEEISGKLRIVEE